LRILCLVSLAPISCFAQLALPSGGNVVRVTSPSTGADVEGPVTIVARLDSVGGRTVAGVQIRLDGFDLGAEDTTPPFEASWDTRTTSDGWHTLTAVARTDTGEQFVSDPVTVTASNAAPPPTPVTRYEDTDPSVNYDLGWMQRGPDNGLAWSGDSAMQSVVPGSRATFAFNGTSVAWIGYRSPDSGIARVLVDGYTVGEVDLFTYWRRENAMRVFTVNGLTNSGHILTIEVTGRKHPEATLNNIVVDAFEVPAPPVSRLQDTDPAVAYTAGWTGGDLSKPWSDGSATVSTGAGARATLTFGGTEIRWLGLRDVGTGIARVYLDGTSVGMIDTYAAQPRVQDTIYIARDLAEGVPHTLAIEASGLKNAASTGTSIFIDAFEVRSSGERFQETDWSVTYTGAWKHGNRNRPWSDGTSAVAYAGGGRATFRFTGTSVSWIGFRAARTGIARVYIDDAFVADVDTYTPTGEGVQNTVFTAADLVDGPHTLTIEATGRKNPAATNSYVVIDAFDVRR